MNTSMPTARAARWLAACTLALLGLAAHAEDAAALQARYAALQEPLRNNDFGRPLYIESSEGSDRLSGDVYAVLDHPFKAVTEALKEPAGWCDIMMLPFNTKYCRAQGTQDNPTLDVRIGRKADQPVEDAYRINFALRPVAATPEFFESALSAASGPVGTRNYRIAVSAVPLAGGKTFLHLNYSYGYGFAGRVAMQAYLATAGAGKIGFSQSGRNDRGDPVYTGGTRGAIERNTMRYYLAIDAHLKSLSAPPQQRTEQRIAAWFSATERYARQLHEMDRTQYVAMKRDEYERAQAVLQ